MINLAITFIMLGVLIGATTVYLARRSLNIKDVLRIIRGDYLVEDFLTNEQDHQIFFPTDGSASPTFRFLTRHMLFLQAVEEQLRQNGIISVHDFSDGLYDLSLMLLKGHKFRYRHSINIGEGGPKGGVLVSGK